MLSKIEELFSRSLEKAIINLYKSLVGEKQPVSHVYRSGGSPEKKRSTGKALPGCTAYSLFLMRTNDYTCDVHVVYHVKSIRIE